MPRGPKGEKRPADVNARAGQLLKRLRLFALFSDKKRFSFRKRQKADVGPAPASMLQTSAFVTAGSAASPLP
jgi:hypothetical protein